MKGIVAVVLLITLGSTAGAQVRRPIPRAPTPSLWGTLSIGLFNGNDVSDGGTGSTWDFGRASTPQYRAALEKAISNTASIGAVASYAHVPFTYIGSGTSNSCARCAAHLDVTSIGASFHVGGGIGFHQVIEGTAGILRFGNLEQDSGGDALAPTDGSIDPFFTFGYGFGYSLGPTMQVSVVQDFGLALHEREGLSSEQSNTLRQRTLRLNFRYGFGRR